MGEKVPSSETVALALCGDVMTGRGIDQILPHPGDAQLYEPYLKSALDYVHLAERASGAISRPVDSAYIWGDAREVLRGFRPDAFIINLETAITRSEQAEPKGINYRMNPANIGCLTSVKIDCCVLANNHILDWGRSGLEETLETLARSGLRYAGAGVDDRSAADPAIINLGAKGRLQVFAMAATDSGISLDWAARPGKPGINLLADVSARNAMAIAKQVRPIKQPADLAIASIHWGGNWGYEIPANHRAFAHALIDEGSVDLVHGHSSHHPKAIEIYKGKLIIYGCGDFLNDYEGIGGYEEFCAELVLLYLAECAPSGLLRRLELVPFRIKRCKLECGTANDVAWLLERLGREYGRFGASVRRKAGGRISVHWQ
jgi:poly-gamma-glutamate synthesis protein (capsule biosynthesis protein)